MSTYNGCGCTSEDCRVNGCLTQRQRNETGGVRVQAIEQERADFEAWYEHEVKRRIAVREPFLRELLFEAWRGRAAMQSLTPEPNDLMLSGVLRMPYAIAMATEISRLQFYHRAQQALDELEALQSKDREDAERWREIARRFDRGRLSSKEQFLQAIRLDSRDAPYTLASIIDHARRIEGGS